jgi:YggT family protein
MEVIHGPFHAGFVVNQVGDREVHTSDVNSSSLILNLSQATNILEGNTNMTTHLTTETVTETSESSLRNQELNLHEKERGIAAANQNSAVARIVNIVYFLFGLLEVLLGIRIILHMAGANAGNGFASFIDTVSAPFVAPFASLVPNPALSGTSTAEIATMIAMIVFVILAWIIGRVIWLAFSRPR